MVFGAAEAVKRDLQSRMPLHELIRGMSWKQASKALDERGLTQFQIGMVINSAQTKLSKTVSAWVLDYTCDPKWPNDDIEAIRNLRKLGLVDITDNSHYVLTAAGRQLREALKVIHDHAKEVTGVNYNTDISLSRDGLMTTCSKIAWVLTNREAIQAHRMEQFLKEFSEGQAKIDKALHGIATAEQRVARQLLEQGPPVIDNSYWTEEDQRAQNDVYWMSGGLAFWLNPMGALADPTPAPDWWSPPVNYQSLAQQHIAARLENDVVAKSLLAPPDPAQPEWLCLNKVSSIVYGMDQQVDVDRFIGARKHIGEGFTVCRKNSPSYDELFEIYKRQGNIVPALAEDIAAKYDEKAKEMILDELLAELDAYDDDDCDDFESWNAKHEVAKPKNYDKIRTGSSRKGAIVTASYGNLFMVEFDGIVRGFNNRLEAETYIGEQRTLIQQRAEAQKVAEEKRQRQKQLQMNKVKKNEYLEETYKSKSYKSIMKESYNKPYTGRSSKELN